MAAGLAVSGVVNVVLNLSPKAAAQRNFGATLILGASTVITPTERIRSYSSLEGVAVDFASGTPELAAATLFFSQSPRPALLYIGRWNKAASETLLDAVKAVVAASGDWYSMTVAATSLVDADLIAAAGYIEGLGQTRLLGITTQAAAVLDGTSTTDIGYLLKAAKYRRTVVQYSSSAPYAVASLLGRMATVDFDGSLTAITLKFKQEPGVTAETLTETQAAALKAKNVNAFVNYMNGTAIIQEGVTSDGSFIDEVQGLDWCQNAVQTGVYNRLYTSTTKVPQTESGMHQLVTVIESELEQGVANGLIAPGVWNADGFGQLSYGDTLAKGYYVYCPPLSSQSQADREARKSPTIQCAVKLAGAVHSVNAIINVNR